MELSHLVKLVSELPPNSSMNYVRGDNLCTFVKIDTDNNRLYARTPEGKDISFAESFLLDLAEKIVENRPFNTSQLLNNKGSNRAVVDSIIANTSEMYWLDKGRSRYTVWIPSHPHKAGELVEWNSDIDSSVVLSEMDNSNLSMSSRNVDVIIMNNIGANKFDAVKLGLILKKMYEECTHERSSVAAIHLFGLKYGTVITKQQLSVADIVKSAGISNNYVVEVNKGIKLCELISKNFFNTAFWDPSMVIKDGLINNIFNSIVQSNSPYHPYLTAIRTKPFLLLAGISGTGKSRIVREFAFKSCPKCLQDKAGTMPGNYCMIEVKPNWHDSTELLGYYSRLGKAGYQFTKFVKFLVKAKMFPNVPFFVCLDEMNLAPVEQYFAEILSILETRKHPKNPETGEVDMSLVKTEPIIDAQYFRELSAMPLAKNAHTGEFFNSKLTDRDIYLKLFDIDTESDIDEEVGSRTELTTEGLTLPDNVVIIGTVNMDDTTHQFSRKVIDRAMTIEMNGGNLRHMFGGSRDLDYLPEEEQQKWQHAFTRHYVTADEVLETHPDVAEELMEELPARLEAINKALKGTPFEVSYRVLNELTIMVGVMLDEGKTPEEAIAQSVNHILLMKILPRMEGDAEMFALSREYKNKVGVSHDNRLEWLKELAPNLNEPSLDTASDDAGAEEPADKEHPQTAKEKIEEMIDRLNNQEFTRFWP